MRQISSNELLTLRELEREWMTHTNTRTQCVDALPLATYLSQVSLTTPRLPEVPYLDYLSPSPKMPPRRRESHDYPIAEISHDSGRTRVNQAPRSLTRLRAGPGSSWNIGLEILPDEDGDGDGGVVPRIAP